MQPRKSLGWVVRLRTKEGIVTESYEYRPASERNHDRAMAHTMSLYERFGVFGYTVEREPIYEPTIESP